MHWELSEEQSLYANSLRLEYAIDRLSNSSTPIHTVAESLGFRAASHFTRFFLHQFGSTPRAYRHGAQAFVGIHRDRQQGDRHRRR